MPCIHLKQSETATGTILRGQSGGGVRGGGEEGGYTLGPLVLPQQFLSESCGSISQEVRAAVALAVNNMCAVLAHKR